MVLDRAWLLGVARREREALGRTIQYTRADAWEHRGLWRGRPIADVLCHLAASEVAAAALLGGDRAAELEEYPASPAQEPPTVEGWIEWSVARRASLPPIAVALEWGGAADRLLAQISRTSDEEWRERQVPWFGGDLRAGHFVQMRVCQWWIHGQDIREGGGQPMRQEHEPTYVVNDLAIRLIPYALSLVGEPLPGLCVGVELDQVGGGTWLQGTDAGSSPPQGTAPDVMVEGHGPWFALLAAGRADPDQVLYEGLVNVGGDTRAGETILRALRAFP